MRNKFSRITLAAGFMLALAFTIGCSDDKDGGGNWLTCNELTSLVDKCMDKYRAERNACEDYHCTDAVDDKFNKCVEKDACDGARSSECQAHYRNSCGN